MVGTGPPGQLTELGLSLPQAPGEMTQLPVIKAEPQEVNQFLKVTPGKCVQRGTLPLQSWADRILFFFYLYLFLAVLRLLLHTGSL